MRKRIFALAVLLLMQTAYAEVYEGVTAATTFISIDAETDGVLKTLNAVQGSVVSEGDIVGEYQTNKVFASEDGTVAAIHFKEGDSIKGCVLEIMPVERYQIYCTVDEAYQSAESTLVHAGEQVYIKCTANGTHRGVGVITKFEGNEYRVLAIGGEFYVGETVYLYRDSEFTSKYRVGIGTVVINDTVAYESEGKLVKLHVGEGEYVERGELLYEYIGSGETLITSSVSGIVTEVSAAQGDSVQKGQSLMVIAPEGSICVEIYAEETAASKLNEGSAVEFSFADDANEDTVRGVVTYISHISNEAGYLIRIKPERRDLRLNMTVDVHTPG